MIVTCIKYTLVLKLVLIGLSLSYVINKVDLSINDKIGCTGLMLVSLVLAYVLHRIKLH